MTPGIHTPVRENAFSRFEMMIETSPGEWVELVLLCDTSPGFFKPISLAMSGLGNTTDLRWKDEVCLDAKQASELSRMLQCSAALLGGAGADPSRETQLNGPSRGGVATASRGVLR